ncbi:MAG: hypothetical protein WA947_03160 [Phormidesmis sp.]
MLKGSTAAAHRLNPYLSLGLQRNPFVLEDSLAIAPSLWIDRSYSAPPMPRAKQLIQLIGVKGAGKTSHLKRWQAQTGGTYCYYPPGWQRLKMPDVGPIAYWDEADRIPFAYLLVGLLAAVGDHSTIVAGTHTDLSRAAFMVGLPVKTIRIARFDDALLQQWANRRIEAVRIANVACELRLDSKKAKEIAADANGSWREAADQLHVWAARRAIAA